MFLFIFGDVEENNAFVDVYKGSSTTVLLNTQDGHVLNDVKCKLDRQINKLENRVQFRVAAINIVGQSDWSSLSELAVCFTSTRARAHYEHWRVSSLFITGVMFRSLNTNSVLCGLRTDR